MVNIFGKQYYFDLDTLTETCRLAPGGDEVDLFKYEVVKYCVEVILDEESEVDNKIGMFGADELSISFKVAYNTLIKYDILIENNEE